jgi:hypothetical protein
VLLSTLVVTGLTITSCSNDDMPIQDQTTNILFHLPTFERSNTTVDFSGQSSRLLMLEEMGNTIKTAATNGTSKSVRFDPNVFYSNNFSNTA